MYEYVLAICEFIKGYALERWCIYMEYNIEQKDAPVYFTSTGNTASQFNYCREY